MKVKCVRQWCRTIRRHKPFGEPSANQTERLTIWHTHSGIFAKSIHPLEARPAKGSLVAGRRPLSAACLVSLAYPSLSGAALQALLIRQINTDNDTSVTHSGYALCVIYGYTRRTDGCYLNKSSAQTRAKWPCKARPKQIHSIGRCKCFSKRAIIGCEDWMPSTRVSSPATEGVMRQRRVDRTGSRALFWRHD